MKLNLNSIFISFLIICSFSINAQLNYNQKDSLINEYCFSFGTGISFLQNLPPEIYQDKNGNLQLGIFLEKPLTNKISIITGTEFDCISYQFDGNFKQLNNKLILINAQSDIKYTVLTQYLFNIPIHIRIYLGDNINGKANAFFQTGLRTGIPFISKFNFRENNKSNSVSLNSFHNQIIYQYELIIGLKNDFLKNIELFNNSSFGFVYQINPIFKINKFENNIKPIHLTWRISI